MTALREDSRVYEFSPYRLDPVERLLLCDGERVPLSPKAFDALVLLVENSGRVVGKEEFFAKIWPDAFVEEGSLTVVISMIRKALGENKGGPKYVETVSKRGYRFLAVVDQVTERDAGSAPATAQASTQDCSKQDVTKLRTIAVLPFNALGAGAPNPFLQMGLADAIITRLSNFRQFIVRPTSAVMRYESAGADSLVAGRELGVDCVLDGYVQQANDRIRVTVQLIRTCDGSPVWAERFDEGFTDLFALEDSLSQRVASTLLDHLTGEEKKRLTKRCTENTEAYHAYLKGRYFWNKYTETEVEKAFTWFRRAIDLDGQLAQAHAGLADCYNWLGIWGAAPPQEAFAQARDSARTALQLDEMLAEAHTSLAFAEWSADWDWAKAAARFQRAVELNPSYSNAWRWYSNVFAAQGKFDEARRLLDRAREIDPLSTLLNLTQWHHLYCAREQESAVREAQKMLELDPHFYIALLSLALSRAQQQRFDESLAAAHRAVQLAPQSPNALSILAGTLAQAGQFAEARAVLAELLGLQEKRHVCAYFVSMVHAALGEAGHALAWLERASEQGDWWLVWLGVEPRLAALRDDPRFVKLLRRVGLAALP